VRRLLILVAAIVLVDTMVYAATAPLLPYYSHHYHLTKSAAGILAATYAAGTLIASLPAGWLAVRVGVRATIVTGLSLMIASSIGFGLAHTIWLLDTVRFIQGVGGAASWAGGLAWLIGRADPDRRGELIGTTLSAAIGGGLLGPVLGTLATQTSPAAVFCGVGAIGVVLLIVTLSEPAPPRESHPPSLRTLVPALRDKLVLIGGGLTVLSALMYSTMTVLAPLRMSRLGAGEVVVGLAFLLGSGVAALASPLSGRLADRRGWQLPVRASAAASIVCLILLPLMPTPAWLVVIIVLADAGFGAPYPAAGALISGGAERRGVGQAYAFGLFNLTWAIGQVLGGAGSARLAQATSDRVPYWLLAGVCAVVLIAIGTRRPQRPAYHSPGSPGG
jgi:MFS family permease